MEPYATHLEALMKTAAETTGGILEMGCGDYSTLPLAALCKAQGRPFKAVASNREWAKRYGDLVEIVSWLDWKPEGRWGMVFLDHEEKVSQRIKHLPALAEVTKSVVVHDADVAMACDHWEACIDKFSRVEVFNRYVPWTVVLHV